MTNEKIPQNLIPAYEWIETAPGVVAEAADEGVEKVAAECVANAKAHGQCDFSEFEMEEALRWALAHRKA